MAAAPAWSATITYDFNNGTLQGWHNRVWDYSANNYTGGWVDLDPNVTRTPSSINGGYLLPDYSTDNQLFGNNGTQVDPVAGTYDGQGGSNDGHLNTLWLRSPRFALDGSGALTVQMARGRAHGPQPANEGAVAYAATNDGLSGWKGVLLRKDSTGEFVLGKPRTDENDTMVTVTFTAAELASFVGVPCTLDLINSERGGWGWLSMDNVSIPGVLVQAKLQVAAASIGIGGNTSLTVTIPDFAHAAKEVTAYVTNRNPNLVTINGSAAPVVPVTFAAGGASSQTLTVTGTAIGYAALAVGCADMASDSANVAVLAALPSSGLIGRWLTGAEDLRDKSAFAPAGTHDGAVRSILTGDMPLFSTDVPPGATGSSLDLINSGGAMIISNTVSSAPGYQPTFDEGTAKQLSVVFWAKGMPGNWNPFVSKNGEGSTGWQVRRRADANVATFTLRGSGGDDDPFNGSTLINDFAWHHFAATWDGVTGIRKLYVDGKLNNIVPNDSGTMGLARECYLTLGGRSGANSEVPGNTFSGLLFDVQIYGIALSGSTVQNLFTGNTSALVAQADSATIDLGKTGQVSVSIPTNANATAAVTVSVANTTPAIVSLAGAVGNVATLVFPAGGATSQTLTLTGLAEGQAQLTCTAAGLTSASVSLKVYGPHLVGRWFTGAENFADAAGFAAGTHDGVEVGTAGGLSFSTDAPPSKTGKAARFDGTVGLLITNSSLLDAAYAPTFDDLLARQFSVSFWAKGVPGTWNPFISKRGDDGIGWQMRRNGAATATNAFTLRGTTGSNSDGVGSIAMDPQWHHYAAVWDGYTGTRKCYVDGILDPSINLTNDFGPMMMAPNHHLILGARERYVVATDPGIEGIYNGLLYDVRMYNYPLSATEVRDLAFIAAIKVLPAQRALPAPQSMTVNVVLPEGANQSQAVTVQLRNDTPAIISLNGAVANVLTLTYPVGGSVTQQVTVVGITTGTAKLTATGGGFTTASATFNVWADPGSRMIGRWLSGAPSLAETSGFRPAGTHDGVPVGPNAGLLNYSFDVPPGYTGQSLDLTAGQVAVAITNSSSAEAGYAETFDNQMANKFSITFWAKGLPWTGSWEPWISKRGEDNVGYQVRNNNAATPVRPTFTIRGTPGTDDPGSANGIDAEWHHYAATWDGATGSRKLYVDGQSVVNLSGDFGPMALATGDHLVLGGRDQGGFGHWFAGLLYDVRVYSYALPAMEVGVMAHPPTQFTIDLTPTVIPQNQTFQMAVTLPSGATASAPLTVYLTNNSPSVATIVGATGNVYALTFPVGTLVQGVSLLAVGPGQINITAGAASLGSAQLFTVNTVVASKLVGHWLNGAADLTDKSGSTPAGTHDAVVVFGNGINDIPGTMVFSDDVPSGFQGKSLDLTDNTNANHRVGVIVTNSATADGGYLPTFDTDMSWAFSVAFWAKGVPAGWATMVSKRGESGIGWQMRRGGGNTEAFTIRGTASGNQDGVGSVVMEGSRWHHYAAVWDGVNGTRKCYVDGVLDPSVNLTGDFGPMSLAPNHHVGIGVREQGGAGSYESWFGGKLCDVRIYNYPISAAEVTSLVNLVTTPPTLTIQRWTGNQVRISWPTSFTGYVIHQSSSLTTGWTPTGLNVTVEGAENVAYVPVTTSPQFFRLKK